MIAITLIAVAVLASLLAGAVLLLRVGIAREESRQSLRNRPPTRTAALTRRVMGLYVHMPPPPSSEGTVDLADARHAEPKCR